MLFAGWFVQNIYATLKKVDVFVVYSMHVMHVNDKYFTKKI